jgi:signal transduction histidine kinase
MGHRLSASIASDDMKLRLRIALATLAAALPILTLIGWARTMERDAIVHESRKDLVLQRQLALARMNGASPSKAFPTVFPSRVLLPIALTTFASVLLATGPIVRKVRRLTQEVRDSAKGNYQGTITVRGNDEIGELALAFADASREIRSQMARQQQREKTLRAFLENTTHDVMIPLTVLQGHLARFQDRAAHGERLDPSSVVPAMNEAHYMASLIHNLAAAAKLEAGEPQLQTEPVNLNEVVARAVGRHAPIARQHAVTLEHAVPEHPLFARGDVTLIEQAVSNVIDNAVRYNRKNGHVAVLLERAETAQFLLRVVDDGPGIPEEERARIIERHVRGNAARSRDPRGHGLGLNITGRVADLHGWELRLATPETGGLRVELQGGLSSAPITSEHLKI